MSERDSIRDSIYSTVDSPRTVVESFLRLVYTDIQARAEQIVDNNTRQDIAADVSGALLRQSWITSGDELLLGEIEEVALQIENDPEAADWDHFMQLLEKV